MKNNHGFTIIEILIVIAILGVVSGIAIVGFKIVSNSNVNSVTEELDSDLSKIRLQNMTKSERVYMHIRVDDGAYYKSYKNAKDIDASWDLGKKIGSSGIKIYYSKNGVEELNPIDTSFTISFNRNGEVEYYDKDGNSLSNVDYIRVTNESEDKSLKLVITDIGKHFIE